MRGVGGVRFGLKRAQALATNAVYCARQHIVDRYRSDVCASQRPSLGPLPRRAAHNLPLATVVVVTHNARWQAHRVVDQERPNEAIPTTWYKVCEKMARAFLNF